ncbi:hypothetical protein O6H91_11G112200 [Diphasiastrum complanatum]|uniref:Uncharacterized protein n=2 Tax=Diphasiastrum complanatum TaxID=34168 RepID=A0ACC2CCS3_DIPCM|nr:hypothetical protein O6H91_11G110700 [Diphasiastrum complanatum]KAJ7539855.1 hypothetical protein O6H91_11G112200 [Diphasiastrum complanatum]
MADLNSQNLERFPEIATVRRILQTDVQWTTILQHRGRMSSVVDQSQTGMGYKESTLFRVTIIFVSVLLCVLILVVCWDSFVRRRLCNRWRALYHAQQQPETVSASKMGLSRKDVDMLPMIRCGASSPEHQDQGLGSDCLICLNEFSEGDKVRLLPSCSHGFHVFCVDLWLLTNASCPVCRQSLLPQVGLSTFLTAQRQLHGWDEGTAVANSVTNLEHV